MCKSSTEPGGPQRCSGDARRALQLSSADVAAGEQRLAATTAAAFGGHAIAAGGEGDLFADWRPEGPGSADDINRAYRTDIKISRTLAAHRFARTVLMPGRAVIVDTETVSLGGPMCEIAVIRACDGSVLLNTLVNPRAAMSPAAQAVHHISEAEVTADDVPTWADVYPTFQQVTADTVILAYYSDYDRAVIENDCARYRLPGTHVSTHRLRWADVMMPRTHYAQAKRWLKNEGHHRALGDVTQTRYHLLKMAAGDALTDTDRAAADTAPARTS